jgi:Fur family ferric uptake transcriptional regulator|tara:strand:+ start:121 stop:501 length:381 start_codon:yes stop_codon:yes gene_type:complete
MDIYKKTKSVKLIIDTFKNESALTVIELVKRFKTKMNKTTVYRILERLEESGILHSFLDQNGLRRYAKNNKNISSSNTASKHSHFLCEDCGISLCMPLEVKIPKTPNYKIKNSEHLLIGHCNSCSS